MKPPWYMPWPFTIASVTVIDSTARPGPTLSSAMPRPRLARSSSHMALAQARASASGSRAMLSGP